MKSRLFIRKAVNHCYQRSADRGVLFYNVCDRLLFFTIFSVMARRHNVRVYKLVQMPDHIHHSTSARSVRHLSAFVRDYTAMFAREYNSISGRQGAVFEARFSNALKRSDKVVRTNLLYLDNNPVERKLVKCAEEYQWNYLAYAVSSHPFSEKIVLRVASMPLRRALKRVAWMHQNGQYLPYSILRKLFDSLPDDRERDQLIDYIVTTYSVIDHKESTRYFGGYDQEVLAARSNTGSEYDISEGFIGKSDLYYDQFSAILRKELTEIHDLFKASADKKGEWFQLLREQTDAPGKQIAAFLHLPVEVKG